VTVTAPVQGASILLAFRAENVRSFRDAVELSMVATAMAKADDVRQVAWRVGGQPVGVLPVAGVFGANASGKTNLLRAMDDMRTHVLQSFRRGNPTGGLTRRPYLLDASYRSAPSRYEVDIVLNGIRHEYGFVIDDTQVIEEWARRYPNGRSVLLFHRSGDDVELGSVDRAKSRAVTELLRPNALFLSTAASANHATLLPLYAWFERNLLLAEADTRGKVLAFLRAADLGITGAKVVEPDPAVRERMHRAVRLLAGHEEDSNGTGGEGLDIRTFGVTLTHQGADGELEMAAEDESFGTMVWFGLVGPVLKAIADGAVLLADELDSSLHPALVAQLVRLFQSAETNPRRAQLIFNAHDSTLLGDTVAEQIIGRDQIWFTEKREDGSTRMYALADLAPRKEEAIGRRYLAGRYGATPILSKHQFADVVRLLVPDGAD
jgi:hypothetical protein